MNTPTVCHGIIYSAGEPFAPNSMNGAQIRAE